MAAGEQEHLKTGFPLPQRKEINMEKHVGLTGSNTYATPQHDVATTKARSKRVIRQKTKIKGRDKMRAGGRAPGRNKHGIWPPIRTGRGAAQWP